MQGGETNMRKSPIFYLLFLVVSADVYVGNEREPDYEEETVESAAEAESFDKRKKKGCSFPR
jgi:hypothetical protein